MNVRMCHPITTYESRFRLEVLDTLCSNTNISRTSLHPDMMVVVGAVLAKEK